MRKSLRPLFSLSLFVLLAVPTANASAWAEGYGGGHAEGGYGSGPHGRRGGWDHGGGWRNGSYGGVIVVTPFPGGPIPNPYPYPAPYPVPPPGPYPVPAPYPPSGSAGSGNYASLPPAWFYCDDPKGFYPYVKTCEHEWQPVPLTPPPPGSSAPPLLQGWAYCYERKGYYPYVQVCNEPWELVEAGTPRDIELQIKPIWYFCDSTKIYFPYTASCNEQWQPVPAIPPPNAVEAKQRIGSQ